MKKHARPLGLCLLAAAVIAASAAPARAHFSLVSPSCLSVQDVLGNPQKGLPCGENLVATNAVTTYRPGQTITITIKETIYHPGHYRVLLAQSQAQLPADPPVVAADTPCGSTTITANPTLPLLADGLLLHSSPFPGDGTQTMTVKLPDNMTCTNCVLQVGNRRRTPHVRLAAHAIGIVAADVEHGGARQPAGVHRVRHHRGVGGDRAVEPGRIGLLEPEVVEQTGGAAQRRIAGEG